MTKHGGKRKGAGRRYLNGSDPHEGNPVRTVTISVTTDTLEKARELGAGNVSEGFRKAVKHSKEASMNNLYYWEGAGWYASRGEGRNYTATIKVYMDNCDEYDFYDYDHDEVSQAARQQGLGTAFWYDTEAELREAL